MYLNWVAGGDVNIARNAIQATSGGNVGIGEGSNTIARLNVNGSTKMNRSFYNWYQGYWTGNSTYWHMKTSMWGGGSPNGNTMYTSTYFYNYTYTFTCTILASLKYAYTFYIYIKYTTACVYTPKFAFIFFIVFLNFNF
jgi:hypothetical protein